MNGAIKIKSKNGVPNYKICLTYNLSELVFIPSIPYDSKEISEANQNLWELHELFPKDQEIKIVIKP